MRKTGWTNHSSFLVLSGLKEGFTLDVITRGQSTFNNHFPVYWAIFGKVTNDQTNKQPGDSCASLLLTTVRRQSFAIIIQNWVLCGQILRWTWLWKVWSGLVLVGNYQKINFQTQGVPATCDWVNALWLQRNSENAFFGTPCIFASLALSSNPFPSKSF